MKFWEYEVTCNAGCHAQRGVGPATDYGVPWGSPVHAPFAGRAEAYWTDEGGWGIRIYGEDEIFCAQHLAEKPAEGDVAWRQVVAKSGNTGSATTGPHVHAYIILRATGKRVSFQYWLEDIIGGSTNSDGSSPNPTPQPAAQWHDTPSDDIEYYYWQYENALAGNVDTSQYLDAGQTLKVAENPGTGPVKVVCRDGDQVWVGTRNHPASVR